MDIFWEGATHQDYAESDNEFPRKIYALMSDNYKAVFEEGLTQKRLRKTILPDATCDRLYLWHD